MNRRDSLKGLGGLSYLGLAIGGITLPAMAAAAASTKTAPQKALLRGTTDGKVLESLDAGQTWNVVAKFGDHCSIQSINRRGERIYARVGVKGHPFLLESRDARTWVTA